MHILIPAVALSADGCQLVYPKAEEYLVNVHALALRIRNLFETSLKEQHPELCAKTEPSIWETHWVVDCRLAGTGPSALCYLAAYVCKSAFKEERLSGFDASGRVLLNYTDSSNNSSKVEALSLLN